MRRWRWKSNRRTRATARRTKKSMRTINQRRSRRRRGRWAWLLPRRPRTPGRPSCRPARTRPRRPHRPRPPSSPSRRPSLQHQTRSSSRRITIQRYCCCRGVFFSSYRKFSLSALWFNHTGCLRDWDRDMDEWVVWFYVEPLTLHLNRDRGRQLWFSPLF